MVEEGLSFANMWEADARAYEEWQAAKSSKLRPSLSPATKVLSQVTGYAAMIGIRYFIISTYKYTWLGHCPTPGHVLVSRAIPAANMNPSVLEVGKP